MGLLPLEAVVREHARRNPDGLAVVAPSGSLTWAELDESADRFVGYLERRGVGPGERIGWLGRNDVGFLPVLVGARRRRVAIVGINWRLTEREIADCATAVDSRLVVADADFAAGAPLRAALGDRVVAMSGGVLPWADAPRGKVLPASLDDSVLLIFTSGSTGTPKAVEYDLERHEGLVRSPIPFAMDEHSRLCIPAPVFHVAGIVWAEYGLLYGSAQYYLSDSSPAGIERMFLDSGITHSQLVPTVLQMLVSRLHETGNHLPDLRHVAYGASPIPPALLRDVLATLNCRLYQVYGLSESGGTVTYLMADEHTPDNPRLNSVGRPIDGAEIAIVDAVSGEPVPADTTGEVVIRTPFRMRGYLGRPDATAEVFRDGWLHTRDVGRLDAGGYLFLEGRLDDMIITGGENVQPVNVEAVLADMPGVVECAVFGVPDPKWGQRIWAAVIASDASVDEDAVVAFCRARLAHYQCPTRVMVVDELPRNATGKLQRAKLQSRAQELVTTTGGR